MSRIREVIDKFTTRAGWASQLGLQNTPCNTANSAKLPYSWAKDNTFEERWLNAAGTDTVRALSVNQNNQVLVAESLMTADRKSVGIQIQDNASIATQGFFIADQAYRVVGISYMHTTKSSVAGTIYVEKTPSGTAPGSGTKVQSGSFDCTGDNATVQTGTLSTTNTGDSDNPDLQLAAGDMLSIVVAGDTTSLAGMVLTVALAPGGIARTASYYMKANADMTQAQVFFVANRPYIVTGVNIRYSTKSSVTGLKLTVTKDTSTNAAGAGTSLLTDNTNAGILVTQTANTTYPGTLSATAATLRLATGDRLSIKFSGATLTALVGLVVTVTLQELAAVRKEISFFLNHIPGAADVTGFASGAFWIADRDYEVLDAREVHDVAAGAAAKVTVTAESGTTAPGSGTVLVTDNTNAGFDLNATARTVQVATLPVLGSRFLLAGDRLSVKPSGTMTTCVGIAISVALAPR
jgi:hypothetical protein